MRAWRTGNIYSETSRFNVEDNPLLYTVGFTVHAGIVIFLVACAAGYRPAEILDLMGLGWVNSFCFACGHA